MRRRTVKNSILQLLDETPRRWSDIQRVLVGPDKTIYVSLKQLLAAGLVRKEPDAGYGITEQGTAALVEEGLEGTAVDIVRELGPEEARTVRWCLAELLAKHRR
jgi:DNA-binding IclR family transcriptional regulator